MNAHEGQKRQIFIDAIDRQMDLAWSYAVDDYYDEVATEARKGVIVNCQSKKGTQ